MNYYNYLFIIMKSVFHSYIFIKVWTAIIIKVYPIVCCKSQPDTLPYTKIVRIAWIYPCTARSRNICWLCSPLVYSYLVSSFPSNLFLKLHLSNS